MTLIACILQINRNSICGGPEQCQLINNAAVDKVHGKILLPLLKSSFKLYVTLLKYMFWHLFNY